MADKIELTERERIINTLNVSMLNWQIRMIPENKRIDFLHGLLATKHITVSDEYLTELVIALDFDNIKAIEENRSILGVWGKLLIPMSKKWD